MRSVSAQSHSRHAAATSASVVALMAIALAVSGVQGATPIGLNERAPGVRETSAARVVAAAVTAAVREMVGHDTIDSSVAFEFAVALAWLPATSNGAVLRMDDARSHEPPIAPQLLNIPPPTN